MEILVPPKLHYQLTNYEIQHSKRKLISSNKCITYVKSNYLGTDDFYYAEINNKQLIIRINNEKNRIVDIYEHIDLF
jgi:hypothetical protein